MSKYRHTAATLATRRGSILERAFRWIKRPKEERNKLLLNDIKRVSRAIRMISALPFYFGKAHFFNTFLAYHPDSHTTFNSHPEFSALFENFVSKNKLNNAGDTARLWSFILNTKQILSEGIEGDFAELGVWRGNTASVLAYYAANSNRNVILFDTYEGFDKKDISGIDANKSMSFEDTSLELVKKVIGENSCCCEFVKGYFPETINESHKKRQYAIVSLDCDLYEPMRAGLNFFYPLMPRGAILFLHDYSSLHWDGSKKAIDEFCRENGEYVTLIPDKSGSAFVRKTN